MPSPCSPLYAFVADSIFHRDVGGNCAWWMVTRNVIVPFVPLLTKRSKISSSLGTNRYAVTDPWSVMAPVALKVPMPAMYPSVCAPFASFVPAMTTLTGVRSDVRGIRCRSACRRRPTG